MSDPTTPYTPSTGQVRQIYANSMDPDGFDRWIAQIRAEAVENAAIQFPDNKYDVGVKPAAVRKWLRARAARIRALKGETK